MAAAGAGGRRGKYASKKCILKINIDNEWEIAISALFKTAESYYMYTYDLGREFRSALLYSRAAPAKYRAEP
jgi:hypothetical protein